MHVDFECSGGYGGLQLSFRGDTNDLPADQAAEIERAVEDSGIWNLQESDVPTDATGPPDVLAYRLTLRDGDRQTSVTVTDVTAPPPLRPLLAKLRKLALKQN